jgi:hypothetical protein
MLLITLLVTVEFLGPISLGMGERPFYFAAKKLVFRKTVKGQMRPLEPSPFLVWF